LSSLYEALEQLPSVLHLMNVEVHTREGAIFSNISLYRSDFDSHWGSVEVAIWLDSFRLSVQFLTLAEWVHP